MDESQAGIKIARRNINNLRCADDTTLMAESKEELKSPLMKVTVESEKAGLKLNIQKTKIMASSPITSRQIDGEKAGTLTDFIFLGSKITADSDCIHEIKRHLLLGRKIMTNPLLLRLLSCFSRIRLYGAHRRQPTRLLCPWDSSGKNTGVGSHFLLQSRKVKSCVPLFRAPWTAAYQAPPSMGFSRQEYWSGVPLPSLSDFILFVKLYP